MAWKNILLWGSKGQTLVGAENTSFQGFIDDKLPSATTATKNENAHCEEGGLMQKNRGRMANCQLQDRWRVQFGNGRAMKFW